MNCESEKSYYIITPPPPPVKYSITSFIDKTFLKFLMVGTLNTVVGCGVMFFLFNYLDFSYWISSACNYVAGGILSFFLNKFFTFKDNRKSVKQVILFILNLALCYFISYFVAKRIVQFFLSAYSTKIRENISLFCGMCFYTILNFLGQKLIVFGEKNGN